MCVKCQCNNSPNMKYHVTNSCYCTYMSTHLYKKPRNIMRIAMTKWLIFSFVVMLTISCQHLFVFSQYKCHQHAHMTNGDGQFPSNIQFDDELMIVFGHRNVEEKIACTCHLCNCKTKFMNPSTFIVAFPCKACSISWIS